MNGADAGPPLLAYVGSYAGGPGHGPGGITALAVSPEGRMLEVLSHQEKPKHAGYLLHAPTTGTLYAVDERKTDGRGPVRDPAAVHAFRVDSATGDLAPLGMLPSPGPFPTYLSIHEKAGLLVSANHGSFEHVEKIRQGRDGAWQVEYVYDDSTVVLYRLSPTGALETVADVQLFTGHGLDPNSSPQAEGHGQASGHAHCAVFSPDGHHLLVCDKATDRITVFETGVPLREVAALQLAPETGPRHLVFDTTTGLVLVTCEFSSTLASLTFDAATGELALLHQVPTTAPGFSGLNEPADVRMHPSGRFVYVNNRGEDSIAWFHLEPDGALRREGHAPLAASEHPGVAARSFCFTPDGTVLLVADRPAHLVRSFRCDPSSGELEEIAAVPITDPAFIEIVRTPR